MKRLLPRLGVLLVAAAVTSVIAAGNRIDVSLIIDKAEAEKILGEPVKAPAPRNVEGSDGYYSKCNYFSEDARKRLVIRVYQAGSGHDPAKELEAVAENTGAMRALSGLGDKARISSGAQGGLPSQVMILYVVKGNNLITVGIAGVGDEEGAAEKLKGVAQKILTQL
jgi:hypothetical protein